LSHGTVLITGATGQQGGATLNALLRSSKSWRLKALARNPSSPAALAIANRGVDVVAGDLSDERSVRTALAGVTHVYSVQTMAGHGTDGETHQGKLLATLSAEAGVGHFVYSSVGGAERRSGVPHFESKWRVEEHIRALGLPATILRPATFMDNFGSFAFRTVVLSMMRTHMSPGRRLQLIAVADIGAFAVRAFDDPVTWIGRAVELAGDELTLQETLRILRRAGLKPAVALRLPGILQRRLPEDFGLMFEFLEREGFKADIPALRKERPELLTLERWARTARETRS
jgi:uncharacterized protein YbjT (DUF2867 family)